MSDAVIDQPQKRWLTGENVKTTLMGLALAGLFGSMADSWLNDDKGQALCNRYKAEFAEKAGGHANALSDITVGGRKPYASYDIRISGSEYGAFMPTSGLTCNLLEPSRN